jgi:hypothetical protein
VTGWVGCFLCFGEFRCTVGGEGGRGMGDGIWWKMMGFGCAGGVLGRKTWEDRVGSGVGVGIGKRGVGVE